MEASGPSKRYSWLPMGSQFKLNLDDNSWKDMCSIVERLGKVQIHMDCFVSSKKVGNVTVWFKVGYFQMQFEVEILVDHPKTFVWVKRILCLQVKKGFVHFKTSSKCIYTNIDFQQNQQGFTRN